MSETTQPEISTKQTDNVDILNLAVESPFSASATTPRTPLISVGERGDDDESPSQPLPIIPFEVKMRRRVSAQPAGISKQVVSPQVANSPKPNLTKRLSLSPAVSLLQAKKDAASVAALAGPTDINEELALLKVVFFNSDEIRC